MKQELGEEPSEPPGHKGKTLPAKKAKKAASKVGKKKS